MSAIAWNAVRDGNGITVRHQWNAQPDHLDAYLDEFVFRFNRRTSSSRGMLFYRLLQQAVVTPPVTYGDVVSKNTGESQSDTIAG